MEVTFAKSKLQKICNSESKLRGEYGPRMGELIQQRIASLRNATTLEDMRLLPGRCHELVANLKGCLALDLVQPDRLVFRPDHDPLPIDKDGKLEWRKVEKITIVDIGDYH